jgi:hypothetical protein
MNPFKSTIARAAITLGLAAGLTAGLALPAAATPYYHVTIDTSSLAGQDGYLSFLMLTLADVSPVHATISNISEPALGIIGRGDVDLGDGSSVTVGNTIKPDPANPYGEGWNEYARLIHFGDSLSFDVAFTLGALTINPYTGAVNGADTALQVALVDGDEQTIGLPADAIDFDLKVGQDPLVTAIDPAADVAKVPEAPALWLSVTGLGLIGALRRRSSRARASRHAYLSA